MDGTVTTIPLGRLAIVALPVIVVLAIYARWSLSAWGGLYATVRMVLQLLAIGYVLRFIFDADQPYFVLAALLVMMAAAAWIALRPLGPRTVRRLGVAAAAIAVSGIATLALVTQAVLAVEPWYQPRTTIPLAGMVFLAAMNAVGLAAEREHAELSTDKPPLEARRKAYEAAMIPQINTLLAVGLVSLPGMMTGQILSGVDPLVAVRYQIVVMAMLFGVSGMAAAVYLVLGQRFLRERPT